MPLDKSKCVGWRLGLFVRRHFKARRCLLVRKSIVIIIVIFWLFVGSSSSVQGRRNVAIQKANIDINIHVFGTGIDGVVDLQTDAAGLLYLSVTTGELRRVRYVPDTGPRQTLYLSDATSMVTAATNGSGPIEVDRSHGGPALGDGGLLLLRPARTK